MDTFEKECFAAITSKDAVTLSKLFAFDAKRKPNARQIRRNSINNGKTQNNNLLFDGSIAAEEALIWREFIIQPRFHLSLDDPNAAIAIQSQILHGLHRLIPGMDRWILPFLWSQNEQLWKLCLTSKAGESYCEEAARIVNKSFVLCINDRSAVEERSRRWGVLRLVALLFRIYFGMGQLNLCNNVIRALQAASADLPPLTAFPAGQQVAYAFYLGRYHFMSDQLRQAEPHLSRAFELVSCLIGEKSPKQKRRRKDSADETVLRVAMANQKWILHYLIPARLALEGQKPTKDLLQRCSLLEPFYGPAMEALKAGSLRTYLGLLDRHRKDLHRLGTYVHFERLIILAQRNLLRRVWILLDRPSRIEIGAMVGFFATTILVDPEDDPNPLESIWCVIAILIDQGYLRGYIAHARGILVLSNTDPFPPVTSVKGSAN